MQGPATGTLRGTDLDSTFCKMVGRAIGDQTISLGYAGVDRFHSLSNTATPAEENCLIVRPVARRADVNVASMRVSRNAKSLRGGFRGGVANQVGCGDRI